MNTTIIIILGVLILIVVIAIVVVLVKGKNSDEESLEDSGMTFQENQDDIPTSTTEPEPQLTTPQLHIKKQETNTGQNPPIMNNLAQPQQTPSTQPASIPQQEINRTTIPQQQVPPVKQDTPTVGNVAPQDSTTSMYSSNPLPDQSKRESDMENLQRAQRSSQESNFRSNVAPSTTPPVAQPSVTQQPPQHQELPQNPESDLQNIANAINSGQQEESSNVTDLPTTPTQPSHTPPLKTGPTSQPREEISPPVDPINPNPDNTTHIPPQENLANPNPTQQNTPPTPNIPPTVP